MVAELIDERKRALQIINRKDFVPERHNDLVREPHLLINIGGLMFEAPVSVLSRDKGSLLAQLCGPSPPLLPDPDGNFFYFDRDWWLFRYVLSFLRDGSLPEDRQLLSQVFARLSKLHYLQKLNSSLLSYIERLDSGTSPSYKWQ